MPYFADRVQETTSTTGTGSITLAGAKTGYRTFATAFGTGDRLVGYCITNGTDWEVGNGVFNGTTGLTRETIHASSNSNNLVSLTGTNDVFCNAGAELVHEANAGNLLAHASGWAMP